MNIVIDSNSYLTDQVMYGLVDGTFPFQSVRDTMTLKPRKPRGISDACSELLLRMLTKKTARRLTIQECCESEYLRDAATADATSDQLQRAAALAADAPLPLPVVPVVAGATCAANTELSLPMIHVARAVEEEEGTPTLRTPKQPQQAPARVRTPVSSLTVKVDTPVSDVDVDAASTRAAPGASPSKQHEVMMLDFEDACSLAVEAAAAALALQSPAAASTPAVFFKRTAARRHSTRKFSLVSGCGLDEATPLMRVRQLCASAPRFSDLLGGDRILKK